jgi:predicted glycogen debranching enzyme
VAELPRMTFEWPTAAPADELLEREWLVTDGLGGYASGTVGGVNTRRYHGLFVPSLERTGRTVLLPRLEEVARVQGAVFQLDGEERMDGQLLCSASRTLRAFHLDGLLPRWEHQLAAARLSRRLLLVHGGRAVVVEYAHLGGPPLTLSLRPYTAYRFHDRALPPEVQRADYRVTERGLEVRMAPDAQVMCLRALCDGVAAPFSKDPLVSFEQRYRVELRRGLDHAERLQSPGRFELTLREGQRAYFTASLEDPGDPAGCFELEGSRQQALLAQAPADAREGAMARLVLAADQFLIEPSAREGQDQGGRSVIAGYPWFTDWGRDTMIALDGLTLHTGRYDQAAAILRTFQRHVKDGLLPNLFPEGGQQGLYHTADATLWYFHAVDRYLTATSDERLLRALFPTLEEIVAAHLRGTRYGIRIDPADGLLTQGEEGFQLTWMDAKVDGWVVTPRRGKAVELNALWFNALCLMASWAPRLGGDGAKFATHAARCEASFNARFWNPSRGCLFDVVDREGGGDDDAVRPNQLFALSLRHAVLAEARWRSVLDVVERELLTPYGLRTLHRAHPDYQRTYDGSLRTRDAAYHQGTVWPWLLGHHVAAHLRVHRDPTHARGLLDGLLAHLGEAGTGQVSEIFDAEPPHTPRGCPAQAWSVAELLRALRLTRPGAAE